MKDVQVIPYTVYFVILKLLITFLTQNSISRFVSYKYVYFNVISNEYL